ncbi:aminotransferase class I/II-fold pyridoxal phosphate-dependent enzyme [Microbacterium sp. CFH 31415]|uniref:pyridoxal phosphate-dependent aminotransferase n=1 Tax=Microbacterium sp. CFH 31415 TaxID=2921732 RepID=UPI001F138123|nr:aminotransferase class I/II-fold pyridoxal phosphate-dependent enzyme [Microbacterium sp. CFH 31415]MCH6230829.1 aminotransferase class I/II-fold pyridoxal phosphate-dependent enzyme [Microbacterium sp. CFH 31415]
MIATATDIIDLGVGAPDIPTPAVAARAAREAIDSGRTKYAGARGILPLRERIAERFSVDKGFEAAPDDIVVSAGAKLTLFCVLAAAGATGGNVVYTTPHYGGYPHLIRRAGLEGRPVQTSAVDGYALDTDRLRAAIDDDTVAVILNSPSNPTGAMYDAASLDAIVEVVTSCSSALIISDEIYSAFAYDEDAISVGRIAPRERMVVIDGVSKAYGMSGWRVGYAAGPRALIAAAGAVNSQLTNCASSISQHAAAAALTLRPSECADVDRHRNLRDEVHARASSLSGAVSVKPKGGIYQSIQLNPAQIDALTSTGESVADALLRRGGVRLPQDSTFGTPGLLRVTFSVPRPTLQDGMSRLARVLEEL